MEAPDLARLTRFAAKGGIGKCTAVQDCVAERAEDLMFYQGDEIIVLLKLPEEDLFLGSCEGVVGRFSGSAVKFHGKLKKPVFAKRQSGSGSPSTSKRTSTSAAAVRPLQSPSGGTTSPSPLGSPNVVSHTHNNRTPPPPPVSTFNTTIATATTAVTAPSNSIPPVPIAPSRSSFQSHRRIPSTASSISHYSIRSALSPDQANSPTPPPAPPAPAAPHPPVPSLRKTHHRNLSTTSSKSAYSSPPSRQSSRAPSPLFRSFTPEDAYYAQHISLPPPVPGAPNNIPASQPTPTLTDGSSAHSSFVLSPGPVPAPAFPSSLSAKTGAGMPISGTKVPALVFQQGQRRGTAGSSPGAGAGTGAAMKRDSDPIVAAARETRQSERQQEDDWLAQAGTGTRAGVVAGTDVQEGKSYNVVMQSPSPPLEPELEPERDVVDASFMSRSVYSDESGEEGPGRGGQNQEQPERGEEEEKEKAQDDAAIIGRLSTSLSSLPFSKTSSSPKASLSTGPARSILIEDEDSDIDSDIGHRRGVLAASPDDMSDVGFGIGMNLLREDSGFSDDDDDNDNDNDEERGEDDSSDMGVSHGEEEEDATAVGSQLFQKTQQVQGQGLGGLYVANPTPESRASSRSDVHKEEEEEGNEREEEDMNAMQTPMVYDFRSSGSGTGSGVGHATGLGRKGFGSFRGTTVVRPPPLPFEIPSHGERERERSPTSSSHQSYRSRTDSHHSHHSHRSRADSHLSHHSHPDDPHWSDADIYDDYRYSRYSSMYSGSPSSKSGGGRLPSATGSRAGSVGAGAGEHEVPPVPWRIGGEVAGRDGSASERSRSPESAHMSVRSSMKGAHTHVHGERERESMQSTATATATAVRTRTPSPVQTAIVPATRSAAPEEAAPPQTGSTMSPISPLTRAFRRGSDESRYSRDSGDFMEFHRVQSQSRSFRQLKSDPSSPPREGGVAVAATLERARSPTFSITLREKVEAERGGGRISPNPAGARSSPNLVVSTERRRGEEEETVVILTDTPSPISEVGGTAGHRDDGAGGAFLRVGTPVSQSSPTSAPPSPLNPGFPPSPSPTMLSFPQTAPLNIAKTPSPSPLMSAFVFPPSPSTPRQGAAPPAIPFVGIPPPGQPPAHMQLAQQQPTSPKPHQQQFVTRGAGTPPTPQVQIQAQQDSSFSALRMAGQQRMGTTIHGYTHVDILDATGPVPISFLLPGMQPPPVIGMPPVMRSRGPQLPPGGFGPGVARSPPPPSPLGGSFAAARSPPPAHPPPLTVPGSPTALMMNGVPVANRGQSGPSPSVRSGASQVPSNGVVFGVGVQGGTAASAAVSTSSPPSPSPLPRANFFPTVGQPRPRSRSFSDFNSSEITERVERTLGKPRSQEEGNKPFSEGPGSSSQLSNSTSTSNSTPSRMATASSNLPRGKTRPTPGPSPLSLPPTINPEAIEIQSAPSSPLPTITSTPRSGPSSFIRPALDQPLELQLPKRGTLRRAPSPSSLPRSNSQPAQPLSQTSTSSGLAAPPAQRRNSTHSTRSGQVALATDDDQSLKPPSPLKHPSAPRQSSESDRTHSSFNRSDMTSPPPFAYSSPSSSPMNRSASLRSKISIAALRPKASSKGHREPSETATSNAPMSPDEETVQIKDMEFELVRPIVRDPPPPLDANNTSDESDAKDAISIHTGIGGADFRSDGPQSEPRSPTGMSQASFPGFGEPRGKGKNIDPNQSVQAHRDRELKWISTINSSDPAQAKKSKKVKKLLVEGVPSSVRYLVWAHISNSGSKKMANVYAQLSKRRPAISEEIERDVQLSFPDNPQLRDPRGPLVAVLFAYIAMVPDLRYNRGLAIIAGHLLLQSPEEDAFWTFLAMMDGYLRPYFMPSSPQMSIDVSLFVKAIEATDSQLATRIFAELNVRANDVCTLWFSSAFAGTLPLEHLHRVWDLFLYEGIPFLFRVGLAILSLSRRYFLEGPRNPTISPTAYLLRPPPEALPADPEEFLSQVLAVKLKDDDIRKSRQKMEAAAAKQRLPKATSIQVPSHPHLQQAGRPRIPS